MNTILSAALRYAKRGWPVLPLAGKIPILDEWPTRASTDPEEIRDWWTQQPSANVGITTGTRSRLLVLDVDIDRGGDESLRALEARYGPLPQTVEVLTGGGGRHLYFQQPEHPIRNSSGTLGLGLDIRADGGQVVAPPSIHPKTGRSYEWDGAHHPDDMFPVSPPIWLLRLLTERGEKHGAHSSHTFHAGSRNDSLTREAGKLRRIGLSATELEAALLVMNRARCRPPLTDEEVRTIAVSVSRYQPVQERSPTWPVLDEAALYGLAGDIVRMIEPHTESDRAAILVQLLVAFGNILGRGPHFRAEADRHGMNMNASLVGETAKGRKGTSWGNVKRVFRFVDPDWANSRILNGLSSGEGLIWAVRDEITRDEVIREKCVVTDRFQTVVVDRGVADKRLLILESEFGGTLRVMARDGNTLSAVIRQAWDSGDLRTMTKNSPAQATGAHISILAHITKDELCRLIDTTEASNGFCNRFLWVCVRRSKFLPEGGSLSDSDLAPLAETLKERVQFGQAAGEIKRDESARAQWGAVYPALSEGKPGLLGGVVSRAEAQVMRLACLYALLDRSYVVTAVHLRAARALWEYCEASARYIFGQRLGDPVADELLCALRNHPDGMTRTEIRDVFQRNRKANEISRALALLAMQGLARQGEGRPGERGIERWFAVTMPTT